MALTPRLEFRQSQTLVMTPQLMQAIKLLQMSSVDLTAYVEAELERNPLLERDDDDAPVGASDAAADKLSDDKHADEFSDNEAPNSEWIESDLQASDGPLTTKLDAAPDDVFPEDAPPQPVDPNKQTGDKWDLPSARGAVGEAPNLEAYVADMPSLRDHLTAQLPLVLITPSDRMIGRYLVDSVDEAGYLRTDLSSVAERLDTDIEDIEAVLGALQGLEPAGVFARDLAECLALQLRERDRLDPAMQALIDNIELLARHDHAALRRACQVDDEDLSDMIAEIRALDPKPGHAFSFEAVQPVVPDVVVRIGPDGGWIVELNTDTLPKVLVNETYYTTVSAGARKSEEKTYLNDCLQTASWLVKSLDQRARTVLKVSSEIVRQQDAFFAHGIRHLRPLNLKTIAEAIGMHESTVSRVTSNKYMATHRGIFELKYFFTSAIASAGGGESHSAEAVRHRIKQMIDEETADAVLSDDAIVQQLRDNGVDIARRTVAKYREALKIPSSVQRRRAKKAGVA